MSTALSTALVMSPFRNAQKHLKPGQRVDVRVSFDGSWSQGFEIESTREGSYSIRRLNDGYVLPILFPAEDLYPSR